MDVRQITLKGEVTVASLAELTAFAPHLVLIFGPSRRIAAPGLHECLRVALPESHLVGCSSAGEVVQDCCTDDCVVFTALRFRQPCLRTASTQLAHMGDSYEAGCRLALQLRAPEQGQALRHILIFGQGLRINGSALTEGLNHVAGRHIGISGGLAGDGEAFQQTWVVSNQGIAQDNLVAVGFYGDALQIRCGSFGGWQAFGPIRTASRCEGNYLYELDGEPALAIYKRYLGEYAAQLPASGLLFPFMLLDDHFSDSGLIRTILGIDEAQQALILAGEVPQGSGLQLMHANTEALVEGAIVAAETVRERLDGHEPEFTLVVSCVGRKWVMGVRVDEELEAIAEAFAYASPMAGFYSYGEIGPLLAQPGAKLHNQTMTITSLCEVL